MAQQKPTAVLGVTPASSKEQFILPELSTKPDPTTTRTRASVWLQHVASELSPPARVGACTVGRSALLSVDNGQTETESLLGGSSHFEVLRPN